MGFPAETLERFYRNSINDVARFFENKHKNCYKIYNLCSESKRRYNISKFNGMVVEEYSFQDHNPPPFYKLKPFCESVHKWLCSDYNNVAAIHCKAGKGRTGVMICAYLIFAGRCEDSTGKLVDISDAESALEYYGRQRTRDLKGVTIPSQKRYVYYFEYLVKHNLEYRPVRLRLVTLILTSLPIYNGGAITMICELYHLPKQKIQTFDIEIKKGSKHLIFNLPEQLIVQGDIKLEFYIKKIKKEKLFQFCFNTFFIGHGTDTMAVFTEPCTCCSNGEKITIINNNNNQINLNCKTNFTSKDEQLASNVDLSFLELIKSENFSHESSNSSSTYLTFSNNNQTEIFDTISGAQPQPQSHDTEGRSAIFLSPSFKSLAKCINESSNSKMSASNSSISSSNSSSSQSLCKKISSPDLKTFNNYDR